MKRKRILTNRNFPDGKSVEFIERDETGQFYWRAIDYSMCNPEVLVLNFKLIEAGLASEELSSSVVECCFPVEEWFVKEKFEEVGRTYDASRTAREGHG